MFKTYLPKETEGCNGLTIVQKYDAKCVLHDKYGIPSSTGQETYQLISIPS